MKARPGGQRWKSRRNSQAAGSIRHGSSSVGAAASQASSGASANGPEQQQVVQPLRRGRAEDHGEGASADLRVVRRVAVVVDRQRGGREAADGHRGDHGHAADAAGQHPVGAGHRDQAEEDEHRRLAEWRVGDRSRPAHVGQRRQQRRHADGQYRPAAQHEQPHAERGGQQRHQHDRHAHRVHREPAARGGPRLPGARAAGLGAAHGVADIVLQIGHHLDQHRGDQDQECDRAVQRAGALPAQRGADQHRADRHQQAVRSHRDEPGRHGAGLDRGTGGVLFDGHREALGVDASGLRPTWMQAMPRLRLWNCTSTNPARSSTAWKSRWSGKRRIDSTR